VMVNPAPHTKFQIVPYYAQLEEHAIAA
jgi:hypothetical protein